MLRLVEFDVSGRAQAMMSLTALLDFEDESGIA